MLNNVKAKARNVKARESVAPVESAPVTAPVENLPESLAPVAPVESTESAPVAATAPESKATAADKRAAYVADAATAKAIFRALDSAVSVPVKPGAFKAKPLNPKAYSLSERGAAAIYCAVAASGKPLADGESYARRFTIGATVYTIENGAFSDFIGTAYTIDSTGGLGNESFTLRDGASAAIRAKLGNKIAAFKL